MMIAIVAQEIKPHHNIQRAAATVALNADCIPTGAWLQPADAERYANSL
jgi:hypothetical protein